MSVAALYTKGAKVWLQDPQEVWIKAELVNSFTRQKLQVKLEHGEVRELDITSDELLPPLHNPEFLIGGNDLTCLSYLHEPAVLHSLKFRFLQHGAIYTYCGIVLIAVNPYQELPLYDEGTILEYRGQTRGNLDPHVFAVAEEAFTQMERENKDQSIIISGESGAGKTMTAKYAMRYFATAAGSSAETHIEKKILASSPIMEAIGNAKTTRNDNSSRFGKYIELGFSSQLQIQGASMRTYLLEKSRVVFQSENERNYHIFYQLCAAANEPGLESLHLHHQDTFRYTSLGNCPTIDGVDDLETFQDTRKALTLLGFTEKEQMEVFSVCSAILHLGNISIRETDSEGCAIVKDDPSLGIFAQLVGLGHEDVEELRKWLTCRRIVAHGEVFTKPMTAAEASFSRDALAKHTYSMLFNDIVRRINRSLASSIPRSHFVGVLDIYGFETFDVNSFEQFCINYANEKLQQQFNQFVFKLEQEEYVREGIEWKFIDYYDNQPCIDLIEKNLGILSLLDEECKLPRGSDKSWLGKLYDQCKKYDRFSKPRLSNTAFTVAHFAGRVDYECDGFVEKNRDTVLEEQVQVLRFGGNKLVQQLLNDEQQAPQPAPRNVGGTVPRGGGANLLVPGKNAASKTATKSYRQTVGSQFRDSLNLLMNTLNATTPHYIRCVKPNDGKLAFSFESGRAVQQLRACGVIETVRISAAGFPSRLSYDEFVMRYRVLFHSSQLRSDDLVSQCQLIVTTVVENEEKFKFGMTKIFFRAGVVAFLEKRRTDRLKAAGTLVQKMVRGWVYRNRYVKFRASVITGQRLMRGFLARKHAQHIRQTRAAILIQKRIRGFVARRKFQRLRKTAIGLQALARGFLARLKFLDMKRERAAVTIQRQVRGFLARRRYQKIRKQIVLLQCCWRRVLAKRELKALRLEARSLSHVQSLNKGLENKIISLQQKIEEQNKEIHQLRSVQADYKEVCASYELLKQQAGELKASVKKAEEFRNEADGLLEALKKAQLELRLEKEEKVDLVNELEQLKTERMSMERRILELQEELLTVKESVKNHEVVSKESLEQRLAEERAVMAQEYEGERGAYQKLLQDFRNLEERNEELESELETLRGGTQRKKGRGHSRNLSNVSTLSGTSDLPFDGETEDNGYASVRTEPMTSVLLKLQRKVNDLEKDKALLESRLHKAERDSPIADTRRAQDTIRLQELEMENAKIKEDLRCLRQQVATESDSVLPKPSDVFMAQFDAMADELDRRREECIQLRTVLANGSLSLLPGTNQRPGNEQMEDREFTLAFETQKNIIRHLENELQEEKAASQKCLAQYEQAIEKLRAEREDFGNLLNNLNKPSQTQTEVAVLQHEVARVVAENLELQEQLRKLKAEPPAKPRKTPPAAAADLSEATVVAEATESTVSQPPVRQLTLPVVLPAVRKKDASYLGMMEYRNGEEQEIISALIYDLNPRVASALLPGLPAYILFMVVRHADYINDDDKLRSFLNTTVTALKRVIKKKKKDLDTCVLWLTNTLRFLHNLKQYSGEPAFQKENTRTQNQQCLRSFDLFEYRQIFSDLAVWIYHGAIREMEERIRSLIVAAVLEHEAVTGIQGRTPVSRARAGSVRDLGTSVDPKNALPQLLHELTAFLQTFNMYGVDPAVVVQAFRQLFYFINACALNNLLLRKEMCHWSKGIQIRFNISHLEQWVRDQNITAYDSTGSIIDSLQPVIQASQLLQARKTEEDVVSICTMCSRLTAAQIVKILNLYTAADELEEGVTLSFIKKVQAELQKREDAQNQSVLLLDTKFAYIVAFPFSPSAIKLEDVDIPDILNIPHLKKI